MAFGDALAWTVQAPELLALIPQAWEAFARREHAQERAGFQALRLQDGLQLQHEGLIQVGHTSGAGSGTPYLLYTDGEIAPHVDEEFPPFSTLLILENAGLCVTGLTVPQRTPQPKGAFIGLYAHRQHGLIHPETDFDWFRTAGTVWYDEPPETPWIAVSCDFPKLTAPTTAKRAIAEALAKSEAVQAFKRAEEEAV